VPNNTPEEKIQAEELKEILGRILLFEKTPCPFQRTFTVELPETPKTPVRKKPWKPTDAPSLSSLFVPSNQTSTRSDDYFITPNLSKVSSRTLSHSPRLSTSDNYQDPNSLQDVDQNSIYGSEPPNQRLFSDELLAQSALHVTSLTGSSELCQLETSGSSSVSISSGRLDCNENEDSAPNNEVVTPSELPKPTYQFNTMVLQQAHEPKYLKKCSRSVTAPILSLDTGSSPECTAKSPLRGSATVELDSEYSSSAESFHSLQSWHSPLPPPSPPNSCPPSPTEAYQYPHNDIVLPKRSQHIRGTSELTVMPTTPQSGDMTSKPSTILAPREGSLSPRPKTPMLVSDASEKSDDDESEIVTPQPVRTNVRHRATTSNNSRRRSLSPLPAAVNIFSPSRRRAGHRMARNLPTAILQKTCEILLSPPSHLLHLMLNIASKIAAGEWRGVFYGEGESVHWDFEDEYAGEGWTDDYCLGLPNPQPNLKPKPKKLATIPGGSWEVD
jgi:hypothetical protein